MTVADQFKNFDRKIKQNEAQYNLDRKAAKISGLPSENLPKCEHSTSEELKHLKTAFFHLRMDFNKKSQMSSIKNYRIV